MANIGSAAIFIKRDLKVNNKTRDYLIESSETVNVENLWYEIRKDKQKYLVGVIYTHPKSNLALSGPAFSVVRQERGGGEVRGPDPKIKVNINRLK